MLDKIEMQSEKGLIVKFGENDSQHYRVNLTFEGKSESFDFYVGLGNIELFVNGKWQRQSNVEFSVKHNDFIIRQNGKAYTAKQLQTGILTKRYRIAYPDKLNVLECLQMDSQSGLESFEDFCSNCGYDSDSRKAFNVYLDCQKNTDKLRKLFGGHFSEFMAIDFNE